MRFAVWNASPVGYCSAIAIAFASWMHITMVFGRPAGTYFRICSVRETAKEPSRGEDGDVSDDVSIAKEASTDEKVAMLSSALVSWYCGVRSHIFVRYVCMDSRP